ncbi:multicopper oxidase domain-containing protein [Methyloceanibacter sp.]|uniref:multicopper oxidase domain-containing protein n=1 Tax=Methyloceanibacter sp. TaxID=1965321 RepID=UPI003D6CD4CB
MAWDVCLERRRCIAFVWGCALSLAAALLAPSAEAEELIQPPICSAETAGKIPELEGICEVTPRKDARAGNTVKVNLTANTGPIVAGGYTVVTEHFNRSYLTPVVEAMPGDAVAAHLVNWLAPRKHDPMVHGDGDENPTNLHYFHGGIVTPRNSRDLGDAGGDPTDLGDNIYAHLKASSDLQNPSSADFNVPIPGEGELDAQVLESEGNTATIAHPSGLNWYHSHLHGISSDQVLGGMSGLLSVGDAKANVKAACKKAPSATECGDVKKDTIYLKDYTDVRYVLLRDIPLRNVSAPPENAKDAAAEWAPQDRDFPPIGKPPKPRDCPVWKNDGSGADNDPKLRRGFCQRDQNSAWLFTLNGQRFPTITVEGGHNLLLRMGDLSANVAYWLELYNERDETEKLPLTILGLDGVVPAKPVSPEEAKRPIAAFEVNDLLLMPASRAEIYVRNDVKTHTDTLVYILRTKGLKAGTDWWPEIQLARIELKPNAKASPTVVALNAPVEQRRFIAMGEVFELQTPSPPKGCVRDLDPAKGEHRRVTFEKGTQTDWAVTTEIVHPPPGSGPFEEEIFPPSDTDDEKTTVGPLSFAAYELEDGGIDWEGKHHNHVCIRLDPGGSSHKQLWVLANNTGSLHNFHIHQMKFRLAKASELCAHKIDPPKPSHTCPDRSEHPSTPQECSEPDQNFYIDDLKPSQSCPDDLKPSQADVGAEAKWHDTIPMPPGKSVFLIMSFDAKEQVGRFVFHCHILKHEDRGLMAPIEVWRQADQ